jgi:polyphenol oxidase
MSVETVAWRAVEGIDFMTWPAFDDLDVDVVMTTRQGGVSEGVYESLNLALHVADDNDLVIENRRRAARTLGASLDDLVFCNQTHGRGVRVVTSADRGRGTTSLGSAIDGIDAVVTTEPGPVLAMMVADCVPIALYSPQGNVAGAVHSGWRGTVARVAEQAVKTMVELGASADDMIAAVGPAIDPQCYQVGPEVREAALQAFDGDVADVISPDGERTDTFLFDLWEANRRILMEAGLQPDHILVGGVPSGGDGPFFSDRMARPCGRNALLVRLKARR